METGAGASPVAKNEAPSGGEMLQRMRAEGSGAEREKKWAAFGSDPEWLSKRAESERDGPIVASIKNMFLQPTSFSAVQ